MLEGPVWLINKYATPKKYPRHFGLGKALVKKGIPTTVICSVSNNAAPDDPPVFSGKLKVENHEGLRVIWLNGSKISENGFQRILSWLSFEWKVIRIMWNDKEKPEAILASSLSVFSVISGWILSRRHNSRFSFEVRDIWPLSLIELGNYSPSNPLIRVISFIEKFGYKRAKTIIGTMPNLIEYVESINGEWSKKTICVPQGQDTRKVGEISCELSKEFVDKYLKEKQFIVAYAGTLNPNNPIDALLGAAEILDSQKEIIHFIVLGEGSNKKMYQEKFGHLSNVSFPPALPKDQIAHFMSFVHVGYDAFSSRLAKYGLSRNKWIDYMSNKCIVICSYNGFQSMLNESGSGFFVPYGDAKALADKIQEVYSMSPGDREKMGQRAQDFIVENRDYNELANLYAENL